jgi:hypothetical protein
MTVSPGTPDGNDTTTLRSSKWLVSVDRAWLLGAGDTNSIIAAITNAYGQFRIDNFSLSFSNLQLRSVKKKKVV